jgi:aspartate/methionine/tyrosine aminotransferase
MKRSPLQRFELEAWFRNFAFRPGMVNLSPSDPVSPTIGELVSLAGVTLEDLAGLNLDYSQTAGAASVRAAVAELYADLDPDDVVVTSGATEAILLALEAVVDSGTAVIVEHPLYGIYEPLLELLGARIVRYELQTSDRYEYDFSLLERLIRTHKAEMIIVNPYNNPTGRGIASEGALEQLVETASRHRCRIWSDDVFRLANLDGTGLRSPVDLTPDAISVGDVTKAWGLGGLRIGWLACRDHAMVERVLNTRDYTTNSNSIVSERLAEHALSARGRLLDNALRGAREAREALDGFVRSTRGELSWIPPVGGYSGWISVRLNRLESLVNVCVTLCEEHDYLVLPGSVFGAEWNSFVRVGLAAGAEPLIEGLRALLAVAAD